MTTAIIIAIIAAVVIFFIALFAASYIKAKPNEAIRISGMGKTKYLIGQSGFRIPFLQRADRIDLETFQVDVKSTDAIPTNEFININVDAVANLKVSSEKEKMERAFECLLSMDRDELMKQITQILQGNIREIIGTVKLVTLVQERQIVAERIKENVVPDMAKLGIDLVSFNIQTFSDNDKVIENLGIDNIVKISKEASIARATAEREVNVAKAEQAEITNRAKVESDNKILAQNTELELKKAELKIKTDTAKADADAAYDIQQQKRQEEVNVATVNAMISQKEREVELGNKQVELEERKLQASINKKAEAEKYATEKKAEAELFERQKKADAEKYELERDAEMQKIKAEADKVVKEKAAEAVKIEAAAEADARIKKAEAEKAAALAEAEGIKAKGQAEAEAILAKADAMKQYGEAATLQLILDSNVLPEIVKAYSDPMAKALGQVDSITMYGEGNQAKLVEEIGKNGNQIFSGLEKTLGIDIKSVIAGFLGGKMIGEKKKDE